MPHHRAWDGEYAVCKTARAVFCIHSSSCESVIMKYKMNLCFILSACFSVYLFTGSAGKLIEHSSDSQAEAVTSASDAAVSDTETVTETTTVITTKETDYAIWQASAYGRTPGINGAVDMDILYQ